MLRKGKPAERGKGEKVGRALDKHELRQDAMRMAGGNVKRYMNTWGIKVRPWLAGIETENG